MASRAPWGVCDSHILLCTKGVVDALVNVTWRDPGLGEWSPRSPILVRDGCFLDAVSGYAYAPLLTLHVGGRRRVV